MWVSLFTACYINGFPGSCCCHDDGPPVLPGSRGGGRNSVPINKKRQRSHTHTTHTSSSRPICPSPLLTWLYSAPLQLGKSGLPRFRLLEGVGRGGLRDRVAGHEGVGRRLHSTSCHCWRHGAQGVQVDEGREVT